VAVPPEVRLFPFPCSIHLALDSKATIAPQCLAKLPAWPPRCPRGSPPRYPRSSRPHLRRGHAIRHDRLLCPPSHPPRRPPRRHHKASALHGP